MKKKEGPARVDTKPLPRALRPVARAAWPFGVAGFAAGAAAIGAVASTRAESPPCSADAEPSSFGERLMDGWMRVVRYADPAPRRTAGAPPPMNVTPSPTDPNAVGTTTPPVEPSAYPYVTAGVSRQVQPSVGATGRLLGEHGDAVPSFATPPPPVEVKLRARPPVQRKP